MVITILTGTIYNTNKNNSTYGTNRNNSTYNTNTTNNTVQLLYYFFWKQYEHDYTTYNANINQILVYLQCSTLLSLTLFYFTFY